MKKYIDILAKTKLFNGVRPDDIEAMLSCLGAYFKSYKRGEYVFRAGDFVHKLTVLTEGRLLIRKDDYWGNRTIVNIIESGDMFGEAYAAPGSGAIVNDVTAEEDSTVIFFDIHRILGVCPSACRFHELTVRNLFYTISEKNRRLVHKLDIISKRTTREKLITYLSDEAKRQGSADFVIPFNRQQLADFLAVDRSAMSSELGRMRDDGLLTFEKNRFTLLQPRGFSIN